MSHADLTLDIAPQDVHVYSQEERINAVTI
jgi:hypothetical protein